ncbi:MAG TPA: glycosyltransferase family 39 protein [Terriglobales bacterium]|nr:glycosyltransferase family 39 protein [Terriglobales bacterium]
MRTSIFPLRLASPETRSRDLLVETKPSPIPSPEPSDPEFFLHKYAPCIIAGLCLYAALRILAFAAAFPLFGFNDEEQHFLTIQMYADGQLPGRELPPIPLDFAAQFVPYWSPEYTYSQQYLDAYGPHIPPYRIPPDARSAAYQQEFYRKKIADLSAGKNFEAQAPPFYYLVAALWYRVGSSLGLKTWALAYWLRFLNSVLYALFVWLSYKFLRHLFPQRAFLHIGVPLLIAVFPQDVFFAMNRDVLSAPLAAAALLLMIKAMDRDAGYRFLLLASCTVGFSFLTETSNCVLFGALVVTLWFWSHRARVPGSKKINTVVASLFLATLLPLLWMLRNGLVMSDPTGSKAKIAALGWTTKPLPELFHHPLFSWQALSYFLPQLIRTFWHGEYMWHGHWMRSSAVDWFYISSTTLMIAIFLVQVIRSRNQLSPLQRLASFQSISLLAASILFLATISLLFDFHDCIMPSRLHPFFINGRIASGALLPFALAYMIGLETLLNYFRNWIQPTAVLLYLAIFITTAEIVIRMPAFLSPYNFFHIAAF